MQWENQRRSSNVEDRRGRSGGSGKMLAGGGIGVLVIALLSYFTGYDLSMLSSALDNGGVGVEQNSSVSQEDLANHPHARSAALVDVVLASTEDVWSEIFKQNNLTYTPAKLVLFEGSTPTACGTGQAAMGPFYCPGDHKAYIDLTFCDELRDKFKAPGDFAVAYVIAHEIGHHIQNLQGRTQWLQQQRNSLSTAEYNKLNVKLELQADFYAGVWAYYSKNKLQLDAKDLAIALNAANAIGDDRLQMEGRGYVVPESFTHGTSEQRMYWFKKGFETGELHLGKYENIK
jgi:predicted metalloprotease